MEDFKVLIYIVLLVVYFVYQLIKSNKSSKGTGLPDEDAQELPPPQEYRRPGPQQSMDRREQQRPLLKERPAHTGQQERAPQPRQIFTFDDILEEMERGGRRVEREITSEPEMPKGVHHKLEKKPVVKEEGKVKYKSIEIEDKKEEETVLPVSQKVNSYQGLLNSLKNPQGARNAFILSEILNKKY
ncbi:MAG: hypothetical protein ACK4ND_10930 [Cytophagaceae bacterium]